MTGHTETPTASHNTCLLSFHVKYTEGASNQITYCLYQLRTIDDQISYSQHKSMASRLELMQQATAQDDEPVLLKHAV